MDRNALLICQPLGTVLSLSARRAWIEIGLSFARKIRYVSLSARRAWIEITGRSVEFHLFACRSPQGERG